MTKSFELPGSGPSRGVPTILIVCVRTGNEVDESLAKPEWRFTERTRHSSVDGSARANVASWPGAEDRANRRGATLICVLIIQSRLFCPTIRKDLVIFDVGDLFENSHPGNIAEYRTDHCDSIV